MLASNARSKSARMMKTTDAELNSEGTMICVGKTRSADGVRTNFV
jgi:hypothetical protein